MLRIAVFYAALAAYATASSDSSALCKSLTNATGTTEAESWQITNSVLNNTELMPYCYVTVRIANRITAWLKLPQTWNQRYVQVGCGGACGYNAFDADEDFFNSTRMIEQGYVVSANDMGVPIGSSNYDAMADNFQMRVDWGYLATHLAAVVSKDIVTTYYAKDIGYSYHLGFSTGGRQSLVEAQRYPEDFNGLYALSPALNETGVTTYAITSNTRATLLDETNFKQALTANDVALIQDAALAACDKIDGIEDGIISFPRSCHFEVESLLCSYNSSKLDSTTCLAPTAVKAAKTLYSGPISNVTGAQLNLEGMLPGSEFAWLGIYVPTTDGAKPSFYDFAVSFLSHYAFWPDPANKVTPFTIDLSSPTLLARTSKTESLEYGGNADMSKFAQLGGKLIMAQGLSDPAVAPCFARDLYERTGEALGSESRDEFFRFFEIPGAKHGRGGIGADTFVELDYVVAWVERGEAPQMIQASHVADNGSVIFTRPLYPFPSLARYKGKGDPANASSFEPINAYAPYWKP